MVRLYLFAEGQTEQTFADTLLKPHLANFDVFLHGPVLIAHARKKGRIHRGGGRKYLPIKNDITRFLKQEKDKDAFFTTMIDLYSIAADFPGLSDAEALRHMPEKRVELIEQAFAKDIGDTRFVPYLQLHEFEAYLFSDPTCFRFFYDRHNRQIAQLSTIIETCPPERIDDGQHSAPSKRIIAQFPDYQGAKSLIGPQVAERIGLSTIRGKCPHFDKWLSRLELLASGK